MTIPPRGTPPPTPVFERSTQTPKPQSEYTLSFHWHDTQTTVPSLQGSSPSPTIENLQTRFDRALRSASIEMGKSKKEEGRLYGVQLSRAARFMRANLWNPCRRRTQRYASHPDKARTTPRRWW